MVTRLKDRREVSEGKGRIPNSEQCLSKVSAREEKGFHESDQRRAMKVG